MKAKLFYKNKKIEIDNITKCSLWRKFRGLMFTDKTTNPLLFEFKNARRRAIHSLFVSYPFLAIWLEKNKILEYKIISPNNFSIVSKKPFTKLIEVPLNNKNIPIFNFFNDANL